MKNFKIGDKITRVPLIQGGMGVGISLGRLAGSVAKAGGVGIISTAQIGYREEDFDRNPAAANERAIAGEMKKAREISGDGIIGYNIMVALKEYASHVKAAVKAGADIIISGVCSKQKKRKQTICVVCTKPSGTGKRKSDKDCPHCIYRQIRKSNPEILGQKIQKNCRSGSDRRSSGRRTPWFS